MTTAAPGRGSAVVATAAPDVLPAPTQQPSDEAAADADLSRPWITLVWNDPVNLMTYVVFVLQQLFGYSKARATSLMLDVHRKGRAVVSTGSREQMEGDVARLHAAGLWATLQQDD